MSSSLIVIFQCFRIRVGIYKYSSMYYTMGSGMTLNASYLAPNFDPHARPNCCHLLVAVVHYIQVCSELVIHINFTVTAIIAAVHASAVDTEMYLHANFSISGV